MLGRSCRFIRCILLGKKYLRNEMRTPQDLINTLDRKLSHFSSEPNSSTSESDEVSRGMSRSKTSRGSGLPNIHSQISGLERDKSTSKTFIQQPDEVGSMNSSDLNEMRRKLSQKREQRHRSRFSSSSIKLPRFESSWSLRHSARRKASRASRAKAANKRSRSFLGIRKLIFENMVLTQFELAQMILKNSFDCVSRLFEDNVKQGLRFGRHFEISNLPTTLKMAADFTEEESEAYVKLCVEGIRQRNLSLRVDKPKDQFQRSDANRIALKKKGYMLYSKDKRFGYSINLRRSRLDHIINSDNNDQKRIKLNLFLGQHDPVDIEPYLFSKGRQGSGEGFPLGDGPQVVKNFNGASVGTSCYRSINRMLEVVMRLVTVDQQLQSFGSLLERLNEVGYVPKSRKMGILVVSCLFEIAEKLGERSVYKRKKRDLKHCVGQILRFCCLKGKASSIFLKIIINSTK